MTRRQLAAVLIFSGLIAAAGPVALLFKPILPYPCLSSFKRVRHGMTRQEVYAKVGAPCAERRTIPGLYEEEIWYGPGVYFYVRFGDDGRAGYIMIDGAIWRPTATRVFLGRFGLCERVSETDQLLAKRIPAEPRRFRQN